MKILDDISLIPCDANQYGGHFVSQVAEKRFHVRPVAGSVPGTRLAGLLGPRLLFLSRGALAAAGPRRRRRRRDVRHSRALRGGVRDGGVADHEVDPRREGLQVSGLMRT